MFRIPEAEIRCVEPICTDPLQPHTHQKHPAEDIFIFKYVQMYYLFM